MDNNKHISIMRMIKRKWQFGDHKDSSVNKGDCHPDWQHEFNS